MGVTPADIDQAFIDTATQFAASNVFWEQASAFDTMLDYLVLNPDKAGDPTLIANISRVVTGYIPDPPPFVPNPVPGVEAWYDDDGWWVIAAAKGAGLAPAFAGWEPDLSAALTALFKAKWLRFDTYAPQVWATYSTNGDYPPRFEGGVWNYGWDSDNNPGNNSMQGFQNTVTNSLHLLSGLRVWRAAGSIAAFTAADREFQFLTQWFTTPDNPMLNWFDSGQATALVHERVTEYAGGGTVNDYFPHEFWAGDQGIVLGGLVDRLTIEPPDSPLYPVIGQWIDGILTGVATRMTDADGFVQWLGSQAPGNLPRAYNTGTGVLMRYLTYVWKVSEPCRATMTRLSYPALIANAMANYSTTLNADPIVEPTNRLALLVAGQVIGGDRAATSPPAPP